MLKIKILTNGIIHNIQIDGNLIEYVNDYIYLGQSVSFEDTTEKEINRRIAISWKKYWSYKEIMKNKNINFRLKTKLYEMAILPCLTYGCQTWILRKNDENRMSVQQRKMERSMLNIKLSDRKLNKQIRKETKITDVVKRIRSLKWSWAGHLCRMAENRWTKRIVEWIPLDAPRKKGRPKMRWEDVFRRRCGTNWTTQTTNREEWRKLGEAYAEEATSIQNN